MPCRKLALELPLSFWQPSLSSAALARVRLGIGPPWVARSAVVRVLSPGTTVTLLVTAKSERLLSDRKDVRNAVDSGLGNPAMRRQIVAAAALAGWHGGRIANGWWRHGDGGYGWVGPLFWPFSIYDPTTTPSGATGIGFWDYGYPDIYAAIFAPYGHATILLPIRTEPARPKTPQGPFATATLRR